MHIPITDTVDIYRIARTGNKDAYGVSPVATGLDCCITPASTDIVAIYGAGPSVSLYEIFFSENIIIRNGDKLNSGGVEYVVRGVPAVVDNRYMAYTQALGERVI